MKPVDKKTLIMPGLSLFTSLGTLICCALPALMVTIGAGATLAGLVSNVPQLIWLSEYKEIVFSVAGAMMIISGLLMHKNRNAPCPVDPDQARACMSIRRFSWIIYWISVAVFAIGFFFAFVAAKILY